MQKASGGSFGLSVPFCSGKGRRAMADDTEITPQDAIALLKADHRKVEELFEAFDKARGSASKARLVQEICTELKIHTLLEEEIFYPACAQEDRPCEGGRGHRRA